MPVPVQCLPLDPGPPLPKPGRANVMGPDRHMLDTACVESNGHSPSNDSPRVRSDALDAAHVQSSGYMGSSSVWTPTISDGHGSSLSRGHNHVGHFEPRPNPSRTPTSSFTDRWVGYLHQRGSNLSFETESIPDDRSAQRRSSAQRLLEDQEKQQAERQSPPPTASQRSSTSSNNQSQARNDFDKGLRNERTSRTTGRYESPSLTTTQPPSREHDPQPETRPISQDQLVAEVKGIYAGLVMFETKCIEVDNAQPPTADTNSDTNANSTLNNEQWQALIALHRTLLHEHHDFFLASQHPSTSPALQRLAPKYAMPARMWRHGIHSFFDLLRRPLPTLFLKHMPILLYLAYSMLALLYEIFPAFENTWIECLGDLGRYRMAIEDDDLQDRRTWTRVSRHWYDKASEGSPTTGRLYHHLAILARPNAMQRLSYYTKSLGVAVSLRSATRESIMTLFDSVLAKSLDRLVPIDAAFVRVHGTLFSGKSKEGLQELCDGLLEQLGLNILRSTTRWLGANYYIGLDSVSTLIENDPDVDRGGVFKTLRPTLERGPRFIPSLALNHLDLHPGEFLNDFRLWWKQDFSQLPEDFALRRPVQDSDGFLRRQFPAVWIPKGPTSTPGEREAKLRPRHCNMVPRASGRHVCRTHNPSGLLPDIESVEATSQELIFPSYLVHVHEMDCVATKILALLRIVWWASTRSFFLLFRAFKQVPSGSCSCVLPTSPLLSGVI
ncbi:hypothetical protein CDV36_000850 [Fusarium kuroshium]|uniref:Uncharacterized protein n=1 Tax=Fusarium kuroshium TaxID=2010991 RepID=A0A3M2SPE2_9HYPO|nr:hypothetical protein CDV36_000850 [Fusarium kuroshium]